ncbi:S46 family peptidase [Flavobacterium columnare]|uniref:Dipeptidyl-peptidase n=1 Tax=Flavobacterium columnare TaxID=996 RepID=A0AAI8CJP2_9FLAO|nr:S46 family peptidase [Flavobacterium columnare]AMO21074.1 S46 family peptidase [Flavobacterium columnare]MEB3802103.1 S46 family peptidase [Flavobacterium columnare]QOG58153.1 S46 family peptidase [Flavobacterium columnare]QOG60876.1 S46 family peptidase [Flavobacterium columnare]QOG63596.1 S46 family peptidase [Flavobacterium columnare]
MKKLVLSLIAAIMLVPASVKADEGMWFLMFIERLNHRDMQKMGLQLTSEEIYSINNNSLKNAIVQFNGGCTAEMISKEGLVLTNHHCGYDAIAELSSAEKNHLKNGFWASSKKEELKPSSLFVRFFVRMDDCSKRILSVVNDTMTEAEREKAINAEIAKIEKENNEGGKYVVSVRSFFQGNEYYYFVYQDYKDVRLVGTPPESLGKFGGDTDNWEWPRHTADFSMFRVYGDANGNPAEYSENNVPLKPKHHLPVNLGGVKEGDFAMIMGYPGRTNRWMPAGGIEQNVKFAYPAWVEGAKIGMDNMKKYMNQSDALNLIYASKFASTANYWKNRQGMIDALTKFGTAKTKAEQEAKFNIWANKAENKEQYGNVVETINNFYKMTNEKARHDNYMMQMFRTSNFASIGRTIGKQLEMYAKADAAKRIQLAPAILKMTDELYKEVHIPAEKDILAAQLKLYATKSTGYSIAPKVAELAKTNNNDFTAYVNKAFDLSLFTSKEKITAFLANPSEPTLLADPLYVLSNDMLTHFSSKSDAIAKAQNDFGVAFRKLVQGLRDSKIGDIKYPDANSTLRLTYGKVRALPADKRNDATINNYTTLAGQVKKYKKGDAEFDLPIRVLEMNKNKDFGRYADKDGTLHINFLSDNDITGGNSGSPVLNGKGELIGLAFDGNIEAMAGDVIFDKKLQRTINCDIRYVLWVIENFSGAKHIVDEMTLVK